MIQLFLSVTFATALMGLVAYGQTSSSSSPTVATGSTGTTETTTTTESFGTVTDFTPGQNNSAEDRGGRTRALQGQQNGHLPDRGWAGN